MRSREVLLQSFFSIWDKSFLGGYY